MNKDTADQIKEWSNNPHDKLFKSVFSDPKEAASVLQSYLPPAIVEKLDWSSLRLTDKEYVDEEFKKSESDLLYQIQLKDSRKKAWLYVLFEHQSTPDEWMPFRVLKYFCRIWDDSFKEYPDQKKLKPILPVVFYQGGQQWLYSTQFGDLLDADDIFKDYLPQFAHILIDQSRYDDEEFKGETKALITQLLMKAAFHGNLEKTFQLLEKLFPQLSSTGGIDFIVFFTFYLLVTHPDKTREIIRLVSPSIGEEAMNAIEYWKEEGLEKGKLLEKVHTVQNLLESDCDWKFITKITGVTKKEFKQLSQQSFSQANHDNK